MKGIGRRHVVSNELHLQLDLIIRDLKLAHSTLETRTGTTPGAVRFHQWQGLIAQLLAGFVSKGTLSLWHDALQSSLTPS
jgi:hypothetical protein